MRVMNTTRFTIILAFVCLGISQQLNFPTEWTSTVKIFFSLENSFTEVTDDVYEFTADTTRVSFKNALVSYYASANDNSWIYDSEKGTCVTNCHFGRCCKPPSLRNDTKIIFGEFSTEIVSESEECPPESRCTCTSPFASYNPFLKTSTDLARPTGDSCSNSLGKAGTLWIARIQQGNFAYCVDTSMSDTIPLYVSINGITRMDYITWATGIQDCSGFTSNNCICILR